jgi:hypothetical protein
MQVTEVSVMAKYSLDTGHGWKAIEVGATATLDGDETLEVAQQELYARLASQLKTLWANGRGTPSQEVSEASRIDVQPSQVQHPSNGKGHWCAEHGVEFKRYEKNGSAWYSHRAGSGWHNE